jgi:hypothetical protein
MSAVLDVIWWVLTVVGIAAALGMVAYTCLPWKTK